MKEKRDAVKAKIEEYMKMYVPDGEPIGSEKIMQLFEKEYLCVCPLCNGTGIVERKQAKKKRNGISDAAHRLKREGKTIREIAQILGYKHPGSVSHLLSKPFKP